MCIDKHDYIAISLYGASYVELEDELLRDIKSMTGAHTATQWQAIVDLYQLLNGR